MSKINELKAAYEAAATVEDAEPHLQALSQCEAQVRALMTRFEALSENAATDSSMDNARDAARENGWAESDVEFWQFAVLDAELAIDAA